MDPLRFQPPRDWPRVVPGLHGFNVKKHVQGGWFILVVALVITPLVGSQGLKTSGSAPFGRRTPFLLTFPFAFLFLFFLFLRREGFLNETPVGLGVDVLLAGGAVKVTASMTLDLFESRLQFATPHASTFVEADTPLMDLGGFSFVGFASMGFETRVSEKVPTALVASLSGFQTAQVGVKEIGAVWLETATAMDLDLATMFSRLIVRFETVTASTRSPPSCHSLARSPHPLKSPRESQLELMLKKRRSSSCRSGISFNTRVMARCRASRSACTT